MFADFSQRTIVEPVRLSEGDPIITRLALAAMGFDTRRLEFYRWLAANGKEPPFHPSPPQTAVDQRLQEPATA